MVRTDFSDQFRKIIIFHKRIGYDLIVMRQSACLVINEIMVNNCAALFNCTPVDRASDSMIRRDVPVGVPLDLSIIMEWHELPKYNGIQVSQLIYL